MISLENAPLLSGWNQTPALLAFQLTSGGRAVKVYRRHEPGVTTEIAEFSPFVLLSDPALVGDTSGLVSLTPLEGDGEFRWIARFDSWPNALNARDRCRALSSPAPAAPYRFFADPAYQYLLLTGRTSFRELRFADLKRLALDIEVLTTEGFAFPNASRPGDRIIAIALADTTGFRHVLRGDHLEEPALLEECTRLIRERDPDVIEGHNIFRFDLPYLETRARRYGTALSWGRDGGQLGGRPSRLQVAERTIAYRRYEIPGRHIIDTWMLAQLYDVSTRDLPGFGLKEIARHFGLAASDRTYVDPAQIGREFEQSPDRLMAYALDDVIETLKVAAVLAPPYFAQAQFVPFDYQSIVLRGTAAKIDALILREYLRSGRAVPAPGAVAAVGGAFTAIFQQGMARPVLHVDVTSLYPSLILTQRIAPRSDTLGVFLTLLAGLREFRVRAKRAAQEARAREDRAHLQALQQSFKILINAFYGYLAWSAGHWNDFQAADRVTAEGRSIITSIIDLILSRGGVPLEADTDGVYFMPPVGHRPADDEALVEAMATALPPGIQLELDGRYAAMFSYKMKTYALLDEGGRLVMKGSAFRSRGLEPFQRQIIEEIVRLLLVGRGADVKAVIDRWLGDFAAHRVDLRLFARTETLQETLDGYRERVRSGERAVSASYELACASGRAWEPGDQLSYYVAGRGVHVAVNEHAKLASQWDAEHPDENVEYYQAKVREIAERFQAFTDYEGLRPYREDPEPPTTAQLSLF